MKNPMTLGKSAPAKDSTIIQATQSDYERIAEFLNQNAHIHRHLDWFSSLDWLGKQPFLLEVSNETILAVLCAVPENDTVAWLRIFGSHFQNEVGVSWQRLLTEAITNLNSTHIKQLATLAIHPWFEKLIQSSDFQHHQDVIVLEWQGTLPPFKRQSEPIQIKTMQVEDLGEVARMDHLAFPPLWQNSLEGLTKAFHQPGFNTIAVMNDQLVGYQISTTTTITGHLARLAVLPEHQRHGVAFHLVHDLLQNFQRKGFMRVTVNTQSDNHPSLNLYHQFGFKLTSEKIPVFELKI